MIKRRIEQRQLTKFEITRGELDLLKRYVNYLDDDRVFLALHATEPKKLGVLRKSLSVPDSYYKCNGRSYKNLNLLVRRILDYFSLVGEELERLKELEEEISHFKHIKVSLEEISDLKNKIEQVRSFPDTKKKLEAELSKVSPEAQQAIQALLLKEASQTYEYGSRKLNIKYVANHYYVPMILSEEEKIDYIKHIIKTPSEVKFLNNLEDYLCRKDNKFKEFEWWLFSKLDESLDEVYIPYYNPQINDISHFKPDFIFWLKKGSDYFIVFIDPKGIEHRDPDRKIEGYKQIFEDDRGCPKPFAHDRLQVRVFCFLWTSDVNKLPDGYREYWFDSFEKWLLRLGEPLTKPMAVSV